MPPSTATDDYRVGTLTAKKEFFLSADDLRDLPFYRPGGWGGWGNRRFYRESDLREAALRKHGGLEGFRKKQMQRATREARKKEKEEKASRALKELTNPTVTAKSNAAASSSDVIDLTKPSSTVKAANPSATVDPKALKTLRDQMRRSMKANVTWDYRKYESYRYEWAFQYLSLSLTLPVNSKNAAHGTSATCQLHRVSQDEYCTLIGRSFDPNLSTLVKKGAWYSMKVPYSTFMGENNNPSTITGSGGRYNCNNQLGVDPEQDLVVKYAPSQQCLSVTFYIQHRDTFERF